jgi:ATP-dependent Clp protease ATP-binding subunit ClpA
VSEPLPLLPDAAAEAALALANLEASASGQESIRPIHLFSSLLKIVDGVFANEAQRIGVPSEVIGLLDTAGQQARPLAGLSDGALTALRRRVWRSLGPPRGGRTIRPLALAPSTQAVVHHAITLARRDGANALTVSHLFEALVAAPPEDVRPHLHPAAARTPESASPPTSVAVEMHGGTVGRDLTRLAKAGRLNPVVGRRQEIKALARYLQRTSKRNVLLLGEAGVGKTAVVEGLAQRLIEPGAPEFLSRLTIVQIEVADLVADTAHRGDLEQRLRALVVEAEADPNLVLFIDEAHLVMGAGAPHGGLDVANILKPALARDRVRCIAATTTDEFERHIKPDAALLRRFQVLQVPEPDHAAAVAMCRAWARRIERAQDVVIEDEAIEASVSLSALIRNRSLPDKAIDLLENAAAATKIASLSFERIVPTKERPRIGRAQIETVLVEQHGLSPTAAQAVDAAVVRAVLVSHLVGQDEAIAAIAAALEDSRRRPASPRPLAVLLLTGPTGVGKTLAAELLAESAFGAGTGWLGRFNMSELKQHHELARLIGAPPGFVGHDRQGALFEFAERHPQGVILLDEMDKAHLEIQDYFLQLFDKGEARDSRGRKAAFGRYIFVLTCNEPTGTAAIGFHPGTMAWQARVAEGLHGVFRPEFLGRVDAIVSFRTLDASDYRQLLARLVDGLAVDIGSRTGTRIDVETAALDELTALCSGDDGARGFRRCFDRLVRTPLLAFLEQRTASTVTIAVNGGQVTFSPP